MRIAIYAGTFDPITNGHLSVVERGAELFDELWVLVAVNPDKSPVFTGDERMQMIREVTAKWPAVRVSSTSGYVVEFAREQGARYLIRGVRGGMDAESELTLANLNHELAPEIETVFVPAHPKLSEVSSSRLKQLVLAGDDISPYCPQSVARLLKARLADTSTRNKEAPHV
jgi:pantetheine-phosphate adenylyltransferase